MVDLSTSWLGHRLTGPIILGASPLSHDVDVVTDPKENAKQVEDRQVSVVASVTHTVDVPVTVKIGPL